MKIDIGNIYSGIANVAGQEQFQTLFENSAVKIDRIVSQSYSSPENFWYDQAEPEWVIVLRGAATLEFETGNLVALNPGNYVIIPSHTKHRVYQTDPETVWLAVHVKSE
jgi:cupin 2 domain-containing protein